MRFPLLIVLISLVSTQVPAAQNETRAQRLVVAVKDMNGNYVWGLHAKDFTVEENGAPQAITEFTNSDAPVSLGILIDTSLSMDLAMEGATATAEGLVRAAKPQDELMLMTFSNAFGVPQAFTNDPQKIIKKLRGLSINGHCNSPVMDSIIQAAKKMKDSKNRRRALIVFTDGQDTTGGDPAPLRRELVKQEIVLYYANTRWVKTKGELPPRGPDIRIITTGTTPDVTIGGCPIALNQPSAPAALNAAVPLSALAEESGGRFMELVVKTDKAWTKVAEKFLDGLLTDVRGQYTLAYSTTDPGTGLGLAIRVRTTAPGNRVQMRRVDAGPAK